MDKAASMREKSGSLLHLAKEFFIWIESPLFFLITSFLYYSLMVLLDHSWGRVTGLGYYGHLADAFLHGQLNLRLETPVVHDLVYYHDKFYLNWPPFPAVLLIPVVALFGVNFSDVLLTLFLGVINVGLVDLTLRKANEVGLVELSPVQHSLLVFFFIAGTVHSTLAPYGTVWPIGQLLGFACVALAYLSALSLKGWKAFLLCGLALSAALATRIHLIFTGIWVAYYLISRHSSLGFRKVATLALLGVFPVAICAALLAFYNYARFGSITDFGLDYHLMSTTLSGEFQRFGAFNTYYLPKNMYYQLVAYPFFDRNNFLAGGSLFLLSPVFFGIFSALKNGLKNKDVWFLFMAIVITYIPISFFMCTGWVQFGPRFTLDFTIPLLLLTGIGIRSWPTRILGILVAISFIHYLAGTLILLFAG